MKRYERLSDSHNESPESNQELLYDIAEVIAKLDTLCRSLPAHKEAVRTITSLSFIPQPKNYSHYPDAVIQHSQDQDITGMFIEIVQSADESTEKTETDFDFVFGEYDNRKKLRATRSSIRDLLRDTVSDETPSTLQDAIIDCQTGETIQVIEPVPNNQLFALLLDLIGKDVESGIVRDTVAYQNLDTTALLESLADNSISPTTDSYYDLDNGRALHFRVERDADGYDSLHWLEFYYTTPGGNTISTEISQAEGFSLEMESLKPEHEAVMIFPDKGDYLHLREILEEEISRLD